jgi:uncharacterized RDD family membrane protein YckC
MNIKNFLNQTSANKKYATSFCRSSAAAIDLWIVLFLRIAIMQLLGVLWLNGKILKFMQEFNDHFGAQSIKNTPEHIDFIVHNRIFFYALIFYAIVIFVGALYHALLNSSSWQATIGKRLLKITIVKEDDNSGITFTRGLAHYFLCVLPFAFVLYLISYQIRNDLSFFQAITASPTNVFFGIMFVIWIQIHLFTKNKTTAYDMICKTVLIKNKTSAKFPWSK